MDAINAAANLWRIVRNDERNNSVEIYIYIYILESLFGKIYRYSKVRATEKFSLIPISNRITHPLLLFLTRPESHAFAVSIRRGEERILKFHVRPVTFDCTGKLKVVRSSTLLPWMDAPRSTSYAKEVGVGAAWDKGSGCGEWRSRRRRGNGGKNKRRAVVSSLWMDRCVAGKKKGEKK